MTNLILLLLLSASTLAQAPRPSLDHVSTQLNKDLPEVYDHATKLMKTTVENNNLYYHFIVKATKEEFAFAFPKVRTQILSTICSKRREHSILKGHLANIIYRYESDKGLSLGEFMVKPDHCSR